MKKLVLGTLFSVMSIPAFAAPQFAAEVMLGSAKQSAEYQGEEVLSDNDLSVGLRGAFYANDYLALELAYQNYGEISESYTDYFFAGGSIQSTIVTDKVTAKAITAGIKGIIPLDNNVALNARFGISNWDLEYTYTNMAFGDYTADDSGTDMYYGVGVQVKLNKQISLGAEYTATPMKPSIDGDEFDYDVNNFAVSLGYTF